MALHDLAAGLADGAREREVARDVEDELAAHLELAAEALESEGRAPEEARRVARERFGDLDRIRRECLRVRLGGILAMKKLLVVTNLVLLAALVVAAGLAWIGHKRAVLAMDQAQRALEEARAEAARAQGLAIDVSRLQAALPAASPAVVEAIVVEVGDVIETMDQHRQLDIGEQVVVQPDGKVLLHDVGWIDVVGLTREQVERRLTEAYAPYYQDLTVNVIVHKRSSSASAAMTWADLQREVHRLSLQLSTVQVGDVIETRDADLRIDFGERVEVQPDGRVRLKDLGWVEVVGKTPEELEALLTEAYASCYPDLTVDVMVLKPGPPVTTSSSEPSKDF